MSRKKRRKKRSNFIAPFCITLILVVSAGLFCLLAYQYLQNEEEPARQDLREVKETIAEEPVVKEEEAAEAEGEGEKEDENEEPPAENSRYADVLRDEAYMAEHNIYAKEAFDENIVTITFAGDILFDPSYSVMAKLLQNGGDIGSGIAPERRYHDAQQRICLFGQRHADAGKAVYVPRKTRIRILSDGARRGYRFACQ